MEGDDGPDRRRHADVWDLWEESGIGGYIRIDDAEDI
jgi:hypothetical protein